MSERVSGVVLVAKGFGARVPYRPRLGWVCHLTRSCGGQGMGIDGSWWQAKGGMGYYPSSLSLPSQCQRNPMHGLASGHMGQ